MPPPVRMRNCSTCEPLLKIMASVVPAPEVLCTVSVEDAVEPPITSGLVRLVEPDNVVKLPAAAAVPPMAGGEAR